MIRRDHRQTAEVLAADLYTGAELILLTEDGPLRERLERAYRQMALHATPLAPQLPDDLRDRMDTLHLLLTGRRTGEGRDEASDFLTTLPTLSHDELVRAACGIADLAELLTRAVHLDPSAPDPVI
jgi:hypothetical protein